MTNIYKFIKPQNISFSLFVILDYLKDHEGCTINEIAKAMGISRTPVHNKLHKLRVMKLIETTSSEDLSDFRRVRVFLSQEGSKLVERAKEILRAKL